MKTLLAILLLAPAAWADTVNFDLSGKIYTKYMYQNDNTQGCLSISNPFWVDNIGGHNGVCTEFEMNIKARVGPRVSAGVRLQSRWGMLWQDWWENGDLKRGVQDTSGESLGMNHAQYIKLRGAFARVAPPIPTVSWVTIGSTDYSMWNEWTIGKARYIDRDNGNGIFVEGDLLPQKKLSYTTGGVTLSLGVQRGSVVRYDLYDRGADVDEYLSVPEYFRPLPPGDAYALGANATVVGRLTGADPKRVREVARTAASPGELPPAQELYEQLATVMGVQP